MLDSYISALCRYAERTGLLQPEDLVFARNALLEALQLDSFDEAAAPAEASLADILQVLTGDAVARGVCPDNQVARDLFDTKLMGVLTPRPHEVRTCFHTLYQISPQKATDWFYRFSQDTNYIRRDRIAKDKKWTYACEYGELDITINLSKPEKDPRDIAAAGVAKNTGEKYPACQLCIENEGYPGRSAAADGGAHPARQNLRVIPIQLDGERWGFQYSPYAYFNEHCIAMSSEHRPMHVDRKGLTCLLDFVDLFPHYFIGSNADLPIVGGSILSHDHFQGGAHEFPMMHAAEVSQFSVPGFDQVSGTVLQWPLSVLRLRSHDRAQLLDAAESFGEPLTIALLPDHPTPCRLKTHTNAPIPFVIYKPGETPDAVQVYDEESVAGGYYGTLSGDAFIRAFFAEPDSEE